MENEAAKPVRYRIQPIHINGVLIGTEQIHNDDKGILASYSTIIRFSKYDS